MYYKKIMKRLVKIGSLFLALVMLLVAFATVSYARSIDDDFPDIYDAYWSNKVAKWSVDGRAHRYEVNLFRDGRLVSSKVQTGKSKNFASEMTRGDHEYYFEVRPYNNNTGWGNWVTSDSIYVTNWNYVPNDTAPIIADGGPGINTNIPAPQVVNGASVTGNWMSANGRWYYAYSNGVFATNTWLQINNKWYYFDASGAMLTGLNNIGNHTYYLNPDGSMATGTIVLNGITHYFDANGIMVY